MIAILQTAQDIYITDVEQALKYGHPWPYTFAILISFTCSRHTKKATKLL